MTNLFAVTFCEDRHFSAGLSRTEDSIELGETQHFSGMIIFDDEDVRDSFQREDFRFTRITVSTNKTFYYIPHVGITSRFDQGDTQRYDSEMCRTEQVVDV